MTAAISISPAHTAAVLALLRTYLPGAEVWAYGSRVSGRDRPTSDLDLVAFVSPKALARVHDLK